MMMQATNNVELTDEIRDEIRNGIQERTETQQFLALVDQLVRDTYQEIKADEQDEMLQQAMAEQHLTSYFDANKIITPDRVLTNRQMKSAWFLHAGHLGLEHPFVLSFNFGRKLNAPRTELEQDAQENQQEIEELLQRMDGQAYLWCTSEKLTIFGARKTGMEILPQDLSVREQESISGYVFTPGADPGKISKRLRVNSQAMGVLFGQKPSYFPSLNLGGEFPYRVQTRNSSTVGDGGLACPEFVAKEILELSGAPRWGDIVAFQIVVIGADYSFKGLCNIVPNELWNHPGVDILIDEESVNHQIHNTKVTLGKVMPTRHKKNKRHFYVEPLNLGEVVNRFTDPRELAQQAQVIAENVDRENWNRVMENWRRNQKDNSIGMTIEELIKEMPIELDETEQDVSESCFTQAKRRDEEERTTFVLAYQEANGSPFGMPSLLSYLAAGPSNSWESQVRKSRKKGDSWDHDNDPKKTSTLTGITVSGEKLIVMDPGYAGVSYPSKGYVRLIWHPRKEGELIGIGLSKPDFKELRDAFDGMDVDGDKIQMIPMRDQTGRPHVLLMRSPMSIDGGAILRLNLKDANLLERLGYHLYRQTGAHKYPGLYQVRDGVQQYPDVLRSTPHTDPPQWSTDPGRMAWTERFINRYRSVMGAVCLAAANLDFAELYDPAKHKFNMSEAIIDPSLNASSDPTPVLGPLQDVILQAVKDGTPLDRCTFPRIAQAARALFQERWPYHEFKPVLTCQSHHGDWKRAQEGAKGYLRTKNNQRALLANGPTEWLTLNFGPKLYGIVVEACQGRNQVWSEKAQTDRMINKAHDCTKQRRDALKALAMKQAKDAEAKIVLEAYEDARERVLDLAPGQFTAAWVQVATSNRKRFLRSSLDYVRASGLLKLPHGEVQGYLQYGESLPTAIMTVDTRPDDPIGTRFYVEEAEDRKPGSYWLVCEDDLQVVADLGKEARSFLGMELVLNGFIPEIVSRDPESKWEQAKDLAVFVVANPQSL